jgi:hypothetical protein
VLPPIEPLDDDAVIVRRRDGEPRDRADDVTRSRWPIALAGIVSLLPLMAFRRRRRRRSDRRPVRIVTPLPVHLPAQPEPLAWRAARTDGSSLLPGSAVAWPDRDRGTSPDTEPIERAPTRAPEHA